MFDTSLTSNDLLFMLQGAWVTLKLTAGAMLIGTLAGDDTVLLIVKDTETVPKLVKLIVSLMKE